MGEGPTVRRAIIFFGAGLFTGAVFLWLAVRNIDWSDLGQALAGSRPIFAVPLLMSLAAFFVIRAFRWSIIFRPLARISTAELLPATVLGYAGNIVLPFYLGEGFRVHLVALGHNVPPGSVLGTLFVERLFDFIALFALLAIGLFAGPVLSEQYVKASIYLAGVSAAVIVAFLVFLLLPDTVIKIVKKVSTVLPKPLASFIVGQARLVLSGLSGTRGLRELSNLLLVSLVQWVVMGVCVYAATVALGIKVSPLSSILVLAFAAAAMTLPNSPGFVGTIQLAFMLGLGAYGVGTGPAVAASLYYHVLVNGSILFAGLFVIRRYAALWPGVGAALKSQ